MNACPRCGDRLQSHSLSVWCVQCGWGRNRPTPSDVFVAGLSEVTAALIRELARSDHA